MATLGQSSFVGFAMTAQPEAAAAFYRDILGLRLVEESEYALVFDSRGVRLRLQKVDEVPEPAATTIGWEVDDIESAVKALCEKGVVFERFAGLEQDDLGVWSPPSGARVAWFRDPDGNRLSLSEAPPIQGDPYDRGMATRRAVLGDAHVDAAEESKTPFDADFQRFIVETAWAGVWSRPNLTRRERSMITLALLAGLGHHAELALHLRAAANTGASPDDVREAFLHVAAYAGVPAANRAFQIAKATYKAMEAAS